MGDANLWGDTDGYTLDCTLGQRTKIKRSQGLPELIADIEDDALRVLALARLAISLEDGPVWKADPEYAADKHGSACDALWRELRRQVDISDGAVPVLKHPTVEAQELACRMRGQLRAAVGSAVDEAIERFRFEQ